MNPLIKTQTPLRRQAALQASWKILLKQWILPGWGYWSFGDRLRGKCFFGVWISFIVLGTLQLWVGGNEAGTWGGLFVFDGASWLKSLGAVATMGVGPFYFLLGQFFSGPLSEPIRNLTQEYGSTYIFIAGLLNWLAIFDLFDRTTHRWAWRLPLDERD